MNVSVVLNLDLRYVQALAGIAEQLGETMEETTARALLLYAAYTKFRSEGKTVGATDSKSDLDIVFTDF